MNRDLERRFLALATLFVVLSAAALSLSPAARMRSWQVDYLWSHWLGVGVWAVFFWLAHQQLSIRLPERDPYLLPLAALLAGWGLLTIWRLSPSFGLRQAAWLCVGGSLLIAGFRLPRDLGFLHRYKYVWLSAGLLLTAATFIFGTNPMGTGPRLWLGWAGLYLQPSEPLKLLLIVYLAAYLSDRRRLLLPSQPAGLWQLSPTLIMTGLALGLLVAQRDLGTATLFIFLYAAIVYTATHDRRIPWLSLLGLVAAGAAGYFMFDVVRLRIDAWLNPWLDPSGRSFQIIQSLLAVANGGLAGRGPGLGSPGLVPVSHSDFIYAAISEEYGLAGSVGLLVVIGLLAARGLRAGLHAPDSFKSLLAVGVSAHLAAQSILIIGGNLRLLPLTGVTLPLVSYGGSSLVVSMLELLFLIHISTPPDELSILKPEAQHRSTAWLAAGLLVGILGTALAAGWWAFWRGPDLLSRTDNARRAISDRFVQRGTLLDRHEVPLAISIGGPGSYTRVYAEPGFSAPIGYTHQIYGQAGLEASLDTYLRGTQGNPALDIWWEHLLYGQPPPGLDVRLSLDFTLQQLADRLLAGQPGAVVLVNAQSGELLILASSPSYDQNLLDDQWEGLLQDPASPLFDRASLGLYPAGPAAIPLLLPASAIDPGQSFTQGSQAIYTNSGLLPCAVEPAGGTWGAVISAGCPGPDIQVSQALVQADQGSLLLDTLEKLGFFSAPAIDLPTLSAALPGAAYDATAFATGQPVETEAEGFTASPLQMALAAATLSHGGVRPYPRLAMAINTPQAGWSMLPTFSSPAEVYTARQAEQAAASMAVPSLPIWQSVAVVRGTHGTAVTWYLGGTLPDWVGAPLAMAVLIETADPDLAVEIGQALLASALQK